MDAPTPSDVKPRIELSPEQQAAARAVADWLEPGYDPDRPVFRLFGYAGTGKSTVAMELARTAKFPTFAAFTGKAALEMRKRGCDGAKTIHSLLYLPEDKPETKLQKLQDERERRVAEGRDVSVIDQAIHHEMQELKKPGFRPREDSILSDLLVIDEVSMVGPDLAEDLLGIGSPILCLGDPGQLPPVKGAGYFTNAEPDFLLETVHRQAEGSPILHLATKARRKERLPYGTYGESAVIQQGELTIGRVAREFDQVIVGKNATRKTLNRAIRSVLGRKGTYPEENDRLICLRNSHEDRLLNGSQWIVRSTENADDDTMVMVLEPTEEMGCGMHPRPFVVYKHHFDGREADLPHWQNQYAQDFDFAYAITCHKAQGSQFGSVLVVDESRVFRKDAARWLYTAITRAVDRVVIRR